MFKYLFELILIVIILFFVWNILKRIFFGLFYECIKTQKERKQEENSPKKEKNLNWDAETVEYEEIKDETKQK